MWIHLSWVANKTYAIIIIINEAFVTYLRIQK